MGTTIAGLYPARADAPRRWRIGFANLTEDPAERLEGLGFTGAEVRASWVYAARGRPVELVFFDNDRNRDKALAFMKKCIDIDPKYEYYRKQLVRFKNQPLDSSTPDGDEE